MKKIIWIIVMALVLGVFGYVLLNKSNTTVTTTIPQNNLQASKTVDIVMTVNGFSPASVTINKGDTVKFTNNDSSPHWPASNPHPSHTDYPGFDALKPIPPNQSYSFQFERLGKFGFHDHLDPSLGGSITVE